MTTTQSTRSAQYSWQGHPALRQGERITPGVDEQDKMLRNRVRSEQFKKFPVAVLLGLLALFLLIKVFTDDWHPLLPAVAAGVSVWKFLPARTSKLTEQAERALRFQLASEEAARRKVWGKPGDGLGDAAQKFGQDRVNIGVRGEEMTARRLEALLAIPGVRIFHGMAHPSYNKADVDHVVVCGDRVAILDSKLYNAAKVGWVKGGKLARYTDNGRLEGEPAPSVMPVAVNDYKALLRTRKVRGFVIVHKASSRKGDQLLDPRTLYKDRITKSGKDGGVRIARAEEVIEELGHWFLEGHAGVVDRSTIAALARNKK